MSCSRNQRPQTHVHEVQGSVRIAEIGEDPHNHRLATVTCEVRRNPDGTHFHVIKFRTDFYENHFHEFCGETSNEIHVGDRHVHFLKSVTTCNDGHRHEFRLATFID
ncbi:MAG: YmaF family protein, partial [Candidatus Cellulosilyticum pullistercoris]|nr:YmaF family protein [Candidatus Cellulosilyticum pullistercoris]